jgi:hypothetical protein
VKRVKALNRSHPRPVERCVKVRVWFSNGCIVSAYVCYTRAATCSCSRLCRYSAAELATAAVHTHIYVGKLQHNCYSCYTPSITPTLSVLFTPSHLSVLASRILSLLNSATSTPTVLTQPLPRTKLQLIFSWPLASPSLQQPLYLKPPVVSHCHTLLKPSLHYKPFRCPFDGPLRSDSHCPTGLAT